MRIRFLTSIAGTRGSFVAGAELDVPSLDSHPDFRAWYARGALEILTDPAGYEIARPRKFERAVLAAPAPGSRQPAASRRGRSARPRPASAEDVDLCEPVPELWPNGAAVILGGGPSLTRADVELCKGLVRVIAVNNAYMLAPWAEVLYACDPAWWGWHGKALEGFHGLKYSLAREAAAYGAHVLANTGIDGLEDDPRGLRSGKNGGYQAINLAWHLGIRRVILLGFDMQRTGNREHWHEDHPNKSRSPYGQFAEKFEILAGLAPRWGLSIVNASRQTALECFRRVELEAALLEASEGA